MSECINKINEFAFVATLLGAKKVKRDYRCNQHKKSILKFLLGETKHRFDTWNKEILEKELAVIKIAVRSEKA